MGRWGHIGGTELQCRCIPDFGAAAFATGSSSSAVLFVDFVFDRFVAAGLGRTVSALGGPFRH